MQYQLEAPLDTVLMSQHAPQLFACCVLFHLLLSQRELGMADLSTIEVGDQVFALGSRIFQPYTDRLFPTGELGGTGNGTDDNGPA